MEGRKETRDGIVLSWVVCVHLSATTTWEEDCLHLGVQGQPRQHSEHLPLWETQSLELGVWFRECG